MQYANGSLTDFYQQPEQFRGNSFLGGSSYSVSESWSNDTIGMPVDYDGYFFPEIKKYLAKDANLSMEAA